MIIRTPHNGENSGDRNGNTTRYHRTSSRMWKRSLTTKARQIILQCIVRKLHNVKINWLVITYESHGFPYPSQLVIFAPYIRIVLTEYKIDARRKRECLQYTLKAHYVHHGNTIVYFAENIAQKAKVFLS